MASPISIPPSNIQGYGIDGNWTAFRLQAGSPATQLDVFVSTSQTINYAVLSLYCGPDLQCQASRGGVFSPTTSFDYVNGDMSDSSFFVPTDAPLLGQDPYATFGYDVVGLGDVGYTGYGKHLIGGVTIPGLWLGLMGIKPLAASLGNIKAKGNTNSIIQDLKNQSKIPSISWGYTGGAVYQLSNAGVLGSLTLGGYDRNRFTPNTVSFPMNSTDSYNKYLSMYVQSITASTEKVTDRQMLSEPIYTALDSTISYIYLPLDACGKLADTFQLQWDSKTEFYFIGDTARKNLLAQKPMPSITFTLAPNMQGGQSIDITLPYSAFDLMLLPPIVNDTAQRYFPIKRADSASEYTLGRTFFQEAYVIADFERDNFSVSQAYFGVDQGQHLVPIQSAEKISITHSDNSDSVSPGVIAGPVVAVVVLIILAALGFWFWRRRKRRQADSESDEKGLPAYSDHVAEMDGYGIIKKPEKSNPELEATESGRATPVPNDHDTLSQKRPAGASPLSSPPVGPAETSPNLQSPLSEMDGTATHNNTYFELPGSMAQRRSMGPHEMNAVAETPIEPHTANQNSGPLPDLPEPSPPIESAATTSNPLTAGMETVPPPPPPK